MGITNRKLLWWRSNLASRKDADSARAVREKDAAGKSGWTQWLVSQSLILLAETAFSALVKSKLLVSDDWETAKQFAGQRGADLWQNVRMWKFTSGYDTTRALGKGT